MNFSFRSRRQQGLILALFAALILGAIGWIFLRPSAVKTTPQLTGQVEAVATGADPQRVDSEFKGEPRKTQPAFTPSTESPVIPEDPTDHQVATARVFSSRLIPASDGRGSEADNRRIATLLKDLQALGEQTLAKLSQADEASHHSLEGDYLREKFRKVEAWLASNGASRWAPALRHELASYQYSRGYLDAALKGWEQNWKALKRAAASAPAYDLANVTLGRLLDLNRGYARAKQLRGLLQDAQDRRLSPSLKGRLRTADRGLWLLEHRAAENVMCGPLALNAITESRGKQVNAPSLRALSPEYIGVGLPMTLVAQYATENYGLKARMARRADASVPIPTPAVFHDKDEHYMAVIDRSSDGDEYFVEDRARHFTGWIDREALDARSSGYFLLTESSAAASGTLPSGWTLVEAAEGNRIFGRDGDHKTTECNTKCPPCPSGSCDGMPRYSIHDLPAILRLGDVPVGYDPALGYGVQFFLNYLDLDTSAEDEPNYSHIGKIWTMDWVAWVDHVTGPITTASEFVVHVQGGGSITHRYGPNLKPLLEQRSKTTLTRQKLASGWVYTRTAQDGSKEIYDVSDNPASPGKVFLSKLVDPYGNALFFRYDSQLRLVSITDALGQVTVLEHDESGSDPMRIKSVWDPFGRHADLTYYEEADFPPLPPAQGNGLVKEHNLGRLKSVADQIGITSSFGYDATGVISMTTPYGTTTFKTSGLVNTNPTNGTSETTVEVTDPLGNMEKVSYLDRAAGASHLNRAGFITPPRTVVVAGRTVGFIADPTTIGRLSTYRWGKMPAKVSVVDGNGNVKLVNNPDLSDQNKATILQWFTDSNWSVTSVLQSRKEPQALPLDGDTPPAEDITYYHYPGSEWVPSGDYAVQNLDTSRGIQPTRILRMHVPPGGGAAPIAELTQISYNAQGSPTWVIDPLGRMTEYVYPTNGVTPTEVRQWTSLTSYVVLGKATYNSKKQPLTLRDAANRVSRFTYDVQGRPVTVTDPLKRTVKYVYSSTTGRLDRIESPLSGGNTSFGYDGYGRPNSITTGDGYQISVLYDAFDRVKRITHPDGTYEEKIYDDLHLESTRDRAGRMTFYDVDALGRVTRVIDPLQRITKFEWCSCGSLMKLIDPKGQVTEWDYNVRKQVVRKRYAAGTANEAIESWVYNTSDGRLQQFVGRNGQPVDYTYFVDGRLQSISYPKPAGQPVLTAPVSYTYDPIFGRLATMTDGIGTTNYTYRSIGTLGAGRISTIDGPWANDTITYTYDALGRVANHKIHTTNFASNFLYDSMGRLSSYRNALGQFGFTYDGISDRVASATLPNGNHSRFDYYPAQQDFRLKRILHEKSNAGFLSSFDYGYDSLGRITSWIQNHSSRGFGYDDADQLISFNGTEYDYDLAGNRIRAAGETGQSLGHNALNQIVSGVASRRTFFQGTLDEDAAAVTVAGKAAKVNNTTHTFETNVGLPGGLNTVEIQATDVNKNTTVKQFQVNVDPVGGGAPSFAYDGNGNMTQHNARLYQWDDANRLIAIQSDATPNATSWRTEFAYDGFGRRVKRTEFTYRTSTSSWLKGEAVTYVWCGTQICQKRTEGNAVRANYFGGGESRFVAANQPFANYYYTRDHLGSIREVVDQQGQLKARFDYDPWGSRTNIDIGEPPLDVEFGFTGHHFHARSGLHLAMYRAYAASLGRWLSADPLGEMGGGNLYAYGPNSPIGGFDPLGGIWHHMIPWAGIHNGLPESFINNASNGLEMSEADHKFLHEKTGWNKDWNAFFNRCRNRGRGPTEAEAQAMLQAMKEKYAPHLKGTAAKGDYPQEFHELRMRSRTKRMGGSRGAKALGVVSVVEGSIQGASASLKYIEAVDSGDYYSMLQAVGMLKAMAPPGSEFKWEDVLTEAAEKAGCTWNPSDP
jgi:RHS repeat-associated protein